MHSLSASFVLAYHGCERETGEKLLRYEAFRPSENTYDWLGSGIYFWEANPDRAYDWAVRHAERIMQKTGAIVKPFVVGAAIDLGFCLDLIGTNGLQAVERAYSSFCDVIAASGAQIPENIGGTDLDLRRLDCAVINFLHDARKKAGDQEFDTVRAVFTEGDPLYPKSGFRRVSRYASEISLRSRLCFASRPGIFLRTPLSPMRIRPALVRFQRRHHKI